MARTVSSGIIGGGIAAVVMGLFAMIAAATYQGTGFFTPMYHIASTFIEPTAMMASMERAGTEQLFYFSAGPALVGMLVHLATGAIYGVVFALLARAARLHGVVTVVAGAVFGIAAMLFSSLVGLPLAASLFGGGEPISEMPTMVGWSTFTVEHLIFGIVLGIWVAMRPQDVATDLQTPMEPRIP
ncbi:MAG: hypothetical protein ABR505_11410 [Actinomycetota bacterium]